MKSMTDRGDNNDRPKDGAKSITMDDLIKSSNEVFSNINIDNL